MAEQRAQSGGAERGGALGLVRLRQGEVMGYGGGQGLLIGRRPT